MEPAQTVSNCGLHLQTNHNLASGDLAIGDLFIECFGVHAIESLNVRVHVAHQFCEDEQEENCAK